MSRSLADFLLFRSFTGSRSINLAARDIKYMTAGVIPKINDGLVEFIRDLSSFEIRVTFM